VRYPISDIPQGYAKGLSQSFSESPECLGFTEDELRIKGKVSGHLKLWREGSLVTIQGEMSANVALQCSRCLAIVMTSLHPVVTLRCFPEATTTSDIHETGEVAPEDNLYTYAGMFLDIRPIIHEQVVLAVPPYSYCRPDCQGLCVVCGQDLNSAQCGCSAARSDARFVTLQHLKRTLG
jgi:uncharacterized protein